MQNMVHQNTTRFSLEKLPDEILLTIYEFLTVQSLGAMSVVSRRCCSLSLEQCLWKNHVMDICPIPVEEGLIDNWKHFYMHIHNNIFVRLLDENSLLQFINQLKLMFLIKRICLAPSSPDFLGVYVYAYYGPVEPAYKQIFSLNVSKCGMEDNNVIVLKFKQPTSKLPVFFYGERGISSEFEFVIVNRRATPTTKVLHTNSPMIRLPKGDYHWRSPGDVFRAKMTILSKNALQKLATELRLEPNAFITNKTRTINVDHATARFETSSDTDWRLRQETVNWSDAQIGELQEISVRWNFAQLYNEAMQYQDDDDYDDDQDDDDYDDDDDQ
jgi:hypothetical protein